MTMVERGGVFWGRGSFFFGLVGFEREEERLGHSLFLAGTFFDDACYDV